ncbi:hypothetical protein MGYG_00939 [Nannizzia gypsea CBS 118893]|uniref:Transaldolase n=1 Tax=Arthroderma gypseum (strain ATCC MYA-4604 / CBS 118893) TaxID=535722 RepID=E5R2Y1_ARTGP|nr:hypothetical protein MGYG_00939 [Nannizzia gypsea CBS 118893]EFQ97902.1 hypothetical protein MGYG_00939 [Nannizzia gypsea CBS 118893]
MGVDTRRPILPAPTESVLDTTVASTTGTATDLATDLSRRTDKTSYSIPEDGSPITISTRRRSSRPRDRERDRDRDREDGGGGKMSRSSHHSQTSLLIEYFEGGKKGSGSGGISSRPSVRVRVTPSSSRKSRDRDRDRDRDRIHISENSGGRRPSYTRRISLSTPTRSSKDVSSHRGGGGGAGADDDGSLSSLTDGMDDIGASRGHPLEIEIVNRDSEVSSRYIQPTSDISSMPADSMLDGPLVVSETHTNRRRSHSLSGDETEPATDSRDLLKTPSRRRSRSLSRERIAQKAAEKISGSAVASRDRTRSKQRYGEGSSSGALDYSSRRAGKHRERERDMASPESSYLSTSLASGNNGKTGNGDQYSFKSGTSRSSLNNPKLLETVEDAIRRLILPELKELKKDQKDDPLARLKAGRGAGAAGIAHKASKEDAAALKLAKRSSAPDVSRSLGLDADTRSPVRSPDSQSSRSKERRREKRPSPRREGSGSSRQASLLSVEAPGVSRKKSKGLRDAEAAKIVGTALTTAALKHHDSNSSLGRRDRVHKRSKSSLASGSRGAGGGAGFNDTELIFQKHDVAPMPFRSGIDSDMTRQSILSQQSAQTATALEGEVARGSPRALASPIAPMTPDSNKHHLRDLGSGLSEEVTHEYNESPTPKALFDPHHDDVDFSNNRALSPIQSVASYQADDHHNRSLTPGQEGDDASKQPQRLSIESLSSAASTDLARSTRTADYSHRHPPTIPDEELGSKLDIGESQRNSPSYWDHDDTDSKHLTAYTDDTFTDPLDHGQQIAGGRATNVQYVHAPLGVESAVASLLDPSQVSTRSPHPLVNRSSRSYTPGMEGEGEEPSRHMDLNEEDEHEAEEEDHDEHGPAEEEEPYEDEEDEDLDHDHDLDLDEEEDRTREQPAGPPSVDERPFHERMGVTSPPHSTAQSDEDEEYEEDRPILGANALPTSGSPIPEIGHMVDTDSEINTNPSIIQGPIGGVPHESRDHWPYEPSPPQSGRQILSPERELDDADLTGAGYGAAAGLGVISEEAGRDHYDMDKSLGPNTYGNDHFDMVSPNPRDEGYMSGANHRSNSSATPEPKGKGFDLSNDIVGGLGSPMEADDPFNDKHKRHLSGYSHGMPSPLYDSSTGRGIDRIQSKDIVALMDHLTVRDAQRNARDTEILITLVRSAAEMRNSFEDMKKYIAQQDELLLDANSKGHDRTQKAIGGPRPMITPRTHSKMSSDFEEDLRSKKKNVFKRALKTLSLKSSGDLTNIEEMLLHLLTEVEALRAAQEGRAPALGNSAENVHVNGHGAADGYEDDEERGANTAAATAEQSLYNSPHRTSEGRVQSSQRNISPVKEENEDDTLTRDEQDILENPTPPGSRFVGRHKRGASVPLATPERVPVASPPSADTTPKMSNEKSRKTKSSSSSFFPKISRWSRTTASSMGENLRNSIQPSRKERFSSEASRSNSDLENANYTTAEYYDHRGDDRLRSNTSVNKDAMGTENRPPSPLVPSQLSENPKYRAHRDSLNLQHPQPRQGPTSRYQTQLESQAQHYGAPTSPNSDAWASNPTLGALNRDRPSSAADNHRPMSAGAYSVGSSVMSQSGPPRPPKVRDDGPLIPHRSSKLSDDANPSYAERMAMREGTARMVDHVNNGSPSRSSPGRGVPQRKPTGPRPLTSSGKNNGTLGSQRPQYDYDDY